MAMQEIFIPIQNDQIQADLYGDFHDLTKSTIIMAHGLGGEKQCGLTEFAKFYEEMEFNVCVFDHRGFGQSTGKVKHLVDKHSQLQDWNAVIEYLNQQFQITKQQIILWGYSFSGAHALTLASNDHFKGVIANFPHTDGLASLTLYPKKYLLPATAIAIQDLVLASFGKIKTMPVVAKDRFAILAGKDCYDGYWSIVPKEKQWDNAVPARIVATIGLYRPTTVAHKIQSDTLVMGAAKDSLIPISATRKMAKKIKSSQYIELQCGHFDLFHEPHKSQILECHTLFLKHLR
ncbi:alpha/beta hydrolase [Acinetobacter shaoyimingii]|uniref:Alpha/beta hydrolase n=1 Tax=Acinetobacter shaoyimingii TaxID=2715164 RepID=A0A6G8RV64_9GAMM|nr:alpha/beta fold hydrolase [Acinetobacter shaoyimingii]QIO05826.1 alpha/beta hydrolase [Acinetobacter shaoyimingii]